MSPTTTTTVKATPTTAGQAAMRPKRHRRPSARLWLATFRTIAFFPTRTRHRSLPKDTSTVSKFSTRPPNPAIRPKSPVVFCPPQPIGFSTHRTLWTTIICSCWTGARTMCSPSHSAANCTCGMPSPVTSPIWSSFPKVNTFPPSPGSNIPTT